MSDFMAGLCAGIACMALALFLGSLAYGNHEIGEAEYVMAVELAEEYPAVEDHYDNIMQNGRIVNNELTELIKLWERENVKARYAREAE